MATQAQRRKCGQKQGTVTTFLAAATPPSYSVTVLQQRQPNSYRCLCTNCLSVNIRRRRNFHRRPHCHIPTRCVCPQDACITTLSAKPHSHLNCSNCKFIPFLVYDYRTHVLLQVEKRADHRGIIDNGPHARHEREEEADTMDLGAVDGMMSECISHFPSQLGTHQKGFFLTASTCYHLVHYYYIQQIHDACDDQ